MDNDKLTEQALEACLVTAREAGCPEDQTERFLNSGYVPLPWQWELHAAAREADRPEGPVQIAAGGSRGPGKTHGIFAQGALDDSQRVPKLKGLFLRQTGLAAKESLDDLVEKVLAGHIEYEYKANKVKFPNGSRILLGGFKDEKDIDKYIGIEYDWIAVEEANQLTETKIKKLRGSLRTSKSNWRPRLYTSFNPGGVGHGYVKKTFVEPYREEIEKDTRFIPATYKANPYNNPEYTLFLEELTGQLGEAWREGNFDILAGQYFTEWNEKIHVIEPFEIPRDWKRWCELDYGFDKPSWLSWNAMSPEGQGIIYRELYRSGLTYSMLAEEWNAMTPTEEIIDYLVADPSIWNRDGRSEGGLSGAEIFESRVRELNQGRENRRSVRLLRGNNDRLAGWAAFREWLRPYKTRSPHTGKEIITAKLQAFSTCTEFIRTMPLQVHDERNPEDLNTDLEEHPQDGKRYGIMSRPHPSSTTKEQEGVLFKKAMQRKQQGKSKKLRFMNA